MNEEEMQEIWGDGSRFGIDKRFAEKMPALTNDFREVAFKFAREVYEQGYIDGYYASRKNANLDVA